MNLSRLLTGLGCVAGLAIALAVLRLYGPADARNPAWLLTGVLPRKAGQECPATPEMPARHRSRRWT